MTQNEPQPWPACRVQHAALPRAALPPPDTLPVILLPRVPTSKPRLCNCHRCRPCPPLPLHHAAWPRPTASASTPPPWAQSRPPLGHLLPIVAARCPAARPLPCHRCASTTSPLPHLRRPSIIVLPLPAIAVSPPPGRHLTMAAPPSPGRCRTRPPPPPLIDLVWTTTPPFKASGRVPRLHALPLSHAAAGKLQLCLAIYVWTCSFLFKFC